MRVVSIGIELFKQRLSSYIHTCILNIHIYIICQVNIYLSEHLVNLGHGIVVLFVIQKTAMVSYVF